MKLELKRFDMNLIKDDNVVIYIGSRGSGKTCNIIDTFRYHKDIPIGITISPTEIANQNFSRIMPRMLIYDEYKPDILAKFLDRQKKIMEKYNREIAQYGRTDIDPRAFLLMDDCLYDNSWTKDESIRYIFLNGRHLRIFFMLSMQYALGIAPILRGNADFVFINRNVVRTERQRIYEHWAGIFPSYQVFDEVMNQCTENFECLVIHKSARSNKLTDCVFWYKADPTANFKVCSKELWDLQAMDDQRKAMQGQQEEEDDEEEFDPRIVYRNKGPHIKVKKMER